MAEAKSRCTVGEFRQWQRFAEIEPFGEEREDLRTALICVRILQAAGAKRVSLKDQIVGRLIERQAGQGGEQIVQTLKLMAAKKK